MMFACLNQATFVQSNGRQNTSSEQRLHNETYLVQHHAGIWVRRLQTVVHQFSLMVCHARQSCGADYFQCPAIIMCQWQTQNPEATCFLSQEGHDPQSAAHSEACCTSLRLTVWFECSQSSTHQVFLENVGKGSLTGAWP